MKNGLKNASKQHSHIAKAYFEPVEAQTPKTTYGIFQGSRIGLEVGNVLFFDQDTSFEPI